jgi:hypothetical protein
MALVGSSLPEGLLFDAVKFQDGVWQSWPVYNPIKTITLPASLGADAVIGVIWNAKTAAQAWITGDGDDLELEFTANIDYSQWYSCSLTRIDRCSSDRGEHAGSQPALRMHPAWPLGLGDCRRQLGSRDRR